MIYYTPILFKKVLKIYNVLYYYYYFIIQVGNQ